MELEGKWNQVKGKFKQKYGEVSDDDVTFYQVFYAQKSLCKSNSRCNTTRKVPTS